MSNILTSFKKRILVTGAYGFVGKNLVLTIEEQPDLTALTFGRDDDVSLLPSLIAECDAIIHLAGENRPDSESKFLEVNFGLTQVVCDALSCVKDRQIPIFFSSSIHADQDSAYGRSKRAAEHAIGELSKHTGHPSIIYRFPSIFGKWCRPNYNSVVATFCHNIARDLPYKIHDPLTNVSLVYIDDVVHRLLNDVRSSFNGAIHGAVEPIYNVSLKELAAHIEGFREGRKTLKIGSVGTGFLRALYATYISYIPIEQSDYELEKHADPRGLFVEMLKTSDSGQFSYFTAYPGITRGGHYHHTKSEKFLVIRGRALFRFRHILTDETYEIITDGDVPKVVDTLPGWYHDVTNISDEEMIVMIWANEIFNRDMPDTFAKKILK